MLERFTEGARAVVLHAQDEARALRHGSIGEEHLLLGVVLDDAASGTGPLTAAGLTADGVRDAIRERFGPGEAATFGQLPFTPGARQALDLALREALSLGHGFVGTGHVLLALLRSPSDFVAGMLSGAGGDRLRAEVLERFAEPAGADPDVTALLRILEREGPAAALLREHGITAERVRERLL